jgi:hypothetical protein
MMPACLTLFGTEDDAPQEHWFDALMTTPASPGFRKFRQPLVIVLLPVSLFATLFLTGLAIGDGNKPTQHAPLDGPAGFGAVHLIVPPGNIARQMIPVLGRMPEVGAIRWIDLFLPQDVAAKRALLPGLRASCRRRRPPRNRRCSPWKIALPHWKRASAPSPRMATPRRTCARRHTGCAAPSPYSPWPRRRHGTRSTPSRTPCSAASAP